MITETSITKFTTKVRESGQALENRVKNYLNSNYIPYKYSSRAIDFVINGDIYLDCVGQQVAGSISDKLPTKCFKYITRYNLKDMYILHHNCPITKIVADHLSLLENVLNCRIHILDWNDFVYLTNGGVFETRKAYTFVREGSKARNNKVNTATLSKFFK